MSVVIETTIGDFTVDLFTEERPQTCRNFLKLCKIKYYNWNLFHTVQSNFIAQTGDPTGTGKGGESVYGMILGEEARYYEGERMPKLKHDRIGLLSMVNCGDNMLGSQFFITLDRDLQSLDGEHCVFGEISEGLEIILKLNETICDGDHRPYQDIRISHTVVLEDPYDDPENLPVPDRSPEPTKEALASDRIGADENLDDTAGMTMEEILEMRKDKEAKAAATILEIVGDIPDADIAPPENVLFVCKLNPVTNDDDLEIIFSRFGKIIGCEVIRDRQSGDSLQYAFIEFADRKSCEDAYFKMDNVLIDDRRIHVDFSQSVSKMRWKGKGKGFLYNDDQRTTGETRKNSEQKGDRGEKNSRGNRERYEDSCDRGRSHRKDQIRERSRREGSSDDKNGRDYRRRGSSNRHRRDDSTRNRSRSRNDEERERTDRNRDRDSKKDKKKEREKKSRDRSRSRKDKHKHSRDRSTDKYQRKKRSG
ncbi:peptidyl-prolyl cis-trans isomerase-like 4 [Fopius arisanus]|uniref:Peptidyl-prolyl cis-trans isomerase n=1 Tax=Fopius arisanus TaxID=64838 RepID=A0A0C9R862_9HYME|nr:PREDICTED: peptidyl-prolyl cis-trans isomerase-like 4 [Fopius arisanus]